MSSDIVEKLKEIRQKDKFSDLEWEKRGLMPSNKDLINKMNTLLNQCIDELISQPDNGKRILKIGLSRFDKREFDTEEKEFICSYFNELANILSIDFKNNLNSWLYGSILNTLLKIFSKSEKIVETKVQNCDNCSSKLETFILKRRADINYEAYNIVKCKNCGGYNLIDLDKGIDSLRFGHYEPIEQLNKEEYTKQQAEQRLEQIRFFR